MTRRRFRAPQAAGFPGRLEAWEWLSLGQARTASPVSYFLSSQVQAALRELLEVKVPAAVREQIGKEAAMAAYREFVAGK